MLSNKGNDVLAKIYSDFREDWLKQFPGHNENDVERHFLYSVIQGLNDDWGDPPEELKRLIEEIR